MGMVVSARASSKPGHPGRRAPVGREHFATPRQAVQPTPAPGVPVVRTQDGELTRHRRPAQAGSRRFVLAGSSPQSPAAPVDAGHPCSGKNREHLGTVAPGGLSSYGVATTVRAGGERPAAPGTSVLSLRTDLTAPTNDSRASITSSIRANGMSSWATGQVDPVGAQRSRERRRRQPGCSRPRCSCSKMGVDSKV